MVSVSLIDYIGQMEDGVAVILSLLLEDITYEMVYWFNPSDDFRIIIEDKFYEHYPDVKNLNEYKYLVHLLYHIDTEVLPSRDEIFKEFLWTE